MLRASAPSRDDATAGRLALEQLADSAVEIGFGEDLDPPVATIERAARSFTSATDSSTVTRRQRAPVG